MKVKLILSVVLSFLIIACDNKVENKTGRWYSLAQVEKGNNIFQVNCAECHGDNAQGTFNWRQALPDGSYPPPPLNGSAHAWHHPLKILRMTVTNGGTKIGGKMPEFGSKLSAEDKDAAIAFFQSKWQKRIYDAWVKNGGLK